jgi:hypothetical protein
MGTDGMGRPSMQWKPRENKKSPSLASTDLARLAPQNTKQKGSVTYDTTSLPLVRVSQPECRYAVRGNAAGACCHCVDTESTRFATEVRSKITIASSERSTDQSVMDDANGAKTPRVALRRSTRRLPAEKKLHRVAVKQAKRFSRTAHSVLSQACKSLSNTRVIYNFLQSLESNQSSARPSNRSMRPSPSI